MIAGTKDMIRNGHTRRIYYGIPDSRLRLIAGNHFIASEKVSEFNRAVAAFLHATEGSKVKTMKRLWADRHPGRLDQEMGFDSAVLVPLLEKDGEYHLLFEVRAGVLKCQPGEVCFQAEPWKRERRGKRRLSVRQWRSLAFIRARSIWSPHWIF